MDVFSTIAIVAVPLLILSLVIFIGVRDHRSKRTPFDDGEINSPSMEQTEADATARAAATSHVGPF